MSGKILKTVAEWRALLTPEQYHVLREKGTERPFSGAYWNTQTTGLYRCSGCDAALFEGRAQFDAGCGWPSFTTPYSPNSVLEAPDHSHGMQRTEVLCAQCAGHLGHVFDDGPAPSGLRYCINAVALQLETDEHN